ncbi:hypothetical protein EZS27_006742 [termite gut metagenome]|uniref:BACON domain-containing protein n=1 Tax=termite gut metagenome TaxID=433724 RepID=A0A5J4SHJ7_9ZZZZ
MKKHVFFWKILAGMLPFLFLGTGCDSASDDLEPFFRISEENQAITLSSEESSQTIAVETNTSEWTVYVSAEGRSWCTAVKDGENMVVSVKKNEGLSKRSTTLTAIARNITVEITVTQLEATPALQIKENDKAITFENFGGDVPVAITTNLSADEWDVVFSDQTVSGWCHIQKGNNQLTISVDANIEAETRTAEITITSSRIPADQHPKISVVQFGTGYTLVVPESNKSFTAAQNSSTVTLQTNIPSGQWSYAVDAAAGDWCHAEVVPTADNKDNQLKITVDANSGLELRTAVITISSDLLPDARPTITVTQAGADPILRVANSTQNFAVTGEEVTLDITTNLPLEELSVESSDAAAIWCVPKLEGEKLKITVAANTEQAARNVIVTIKDALRPTAPQATVSVTQELPTLTIAENENTQNIEAVGGELTLDIIETNIPFGELSVVPADGWCKAEIKNEKLEITVESNAGENTLERQTELTISSAKLPGIKATLTVIQLGVTPVLQIPVGSDALSLGYEGGNQKIDLTTNRSNIDIAYIYDIQPASAWCNAIIDNKQLTITVNPNTGETERRVIITLSAADVLPVTITVTQASPVLQVALANATQEFEADGGSKTVGIDTNIPTEKWEFTPTIADWYHVTKSDKKLTIQVDPNNSFVARSATLTLSSTDLPSATPEITVNQKAATPVLQLEGNNTRELDAAGGSEIVATTNIPIGDLTISYGGQSSSEWCSAEIVAGKLKINVTPNNAAGAELRSVVITITSTYLPNTTITITVTQAIPSEEPPTVQWTKVEVGSGNGSYTPNGDQITIDATVGKFTSADQKFIFVYREVTGNFVFTAKLDNHTAPGISNQSRAGLLFTPDITQTANNFMYAFVSKGADGGYHSAHRIKVGDSSRSGVGTAQSSDNTYFKLERNGDKYITSYSTDGGAIYGNSKTNTFDPGLPNSLSVGFAINNGDASTEATATFSDVKINDVPQSFGNP